MIPEFRVVHNIYTPYRAYMFNILQRLLEARGWRFHVDFMAASEPRREHWKPRPGELRFPHRFHRDFPLLRHGKAWHVNPGIVRNLALDPPQIALVNGPWDSITGMMSSVAARRASLRIAWAELNLTSPGVQTGPLARLKHALLGNYNAFAVPGSEGAAVVRRMTHKDAAILTLPNIVEESLFVAARSDEEGKRQVRAELGVTPNQRLAIWPARLAPAKAVVEFIQNMDPAVVAGWRILLIGSGPLENATRTSIAERGLQAIVTILPTVEYRRMPSLYAAADLFLLPSRHDPNPLSPIEAMFAGLPILVSRQLGNYPELLDGNSNGWGVDWGAPGSISRGIHAAFGASPGELTRRGRCAIEVVERHWSSVKALERFVDDALALHHAERR